MGAPIRIKVLGIGLMCMFMSLSSSINTTEAAPLLLAVKTNKEVGSTDIFRLEEPFKKYRAEELIELAKNTNIISYSFAGFTREGSTTLKSRGAGLASPSESTVSSGQATSDKVMEIFDKHCEALTSETATEEGLTRHYKLAGTFWKQGKLTMYDFKQVLYELEYTYSVCGVYKDKNDYLRIYQNDFYHNEWQEGKYDDYLESIYGYGKLGNPYEYEASEGGSMVLSTAYAVLEGWTRGTTGEQLRYSQTKFSWYKSQITGKSFKVRPDCTGLVYTVLKELGSTIVDSEKTTDGFYSGSLVSMCRNGEMDTDPNLKVIPFSVDALEPGDIMVTAKTEKLTRWGTSDYYGRVEGHAEIFVGFPDPANKNITDVWNWGSRSSVERNFPQDASVFIPQRKGQGYNYTYIIRYIGGTEH